MDFIKSAVSFVVSPSHSRTVAILFFIILVVAVPLTVFVSQQQQNTKQRASGIVTCDPACNSEETCKSINEGDFVSYICIPNDIVLNPTPTNVPTPASGINLTMDSTFTPTPIPNTCSPACNSGETCKSINEGGLISYICVNNPPLSVLTPTLTPTLTSTRTPTPTPISAFILPTTTLTPIPTSIPTNAIVQNSPTPFPYCYLKTFGDADCNNVINIVDFQIWKTDFVNAQKGIINEQSNFDNLGGITIVDFNIWKTSMADTTLSH